MPFTFSHPAIVLPLLNKHKKYFSSTGLVIGSMIPDFEAFINFNSFKVYGHTFLGMFWFDLPLGIIFAFIFHLFVRKPLIYNLPLFFRKRFSFYRDLDWGKHFRKHWFIIVTSTLIGIISHLLFDEVTRLKILQSEIENNVFNERLQYVCSALGLIVIAYFIAILPAKPVVKSRNIWPYWLTLITLAAIFYSIILKHKDLTFFDFIDYLYISISAFLYAIVLQSVTITTYKQLRTELRN